MADLRLLVADDHTIVREGIRALLASSPDLRIVGEAGDGREVIRLAGQLNPDLILLDLCMPGLNGTEVIRYIKRRHPAIRIAILTVHNSEDYIRAALDAGADAYILKQDSASELVTAIRSVQNGKTYLSPSICRQVVSGYLGGAEKSTSAPSWHTLTPRERQVIKLIAEGHSNKEIARYLSLSHKTVEKHRANMMQKLNLHNAPAVTAYAIANGLTA